MKRRNWTLAQIQGEREYGVLSYPLSLVIDAYLARRVCWVIGHWDYRA